MEKKDEAIKTPKLKRSFSGLSLSSSSDSGSGYEANEKPETKKAKLKRTSSDSDISDISLLPSSDKESKKSSTSLFEVSPSDGQERKVFNPKLLYSSYSEDPRPYWERLGVNQENLNKLYASLTPRHMDRPNLKTGPTASSLESLIVDESFYKNEESMWNDDDDSPVDEERLNEYLERLAAEDLTKKEVEVEVDNRLREVTTDTYHSLNHLERLNWITTQFILERYYPISQGRWPRPPPPSETSGKERWIFGGNTDSEDSDEDEDPDQEDLKTLEDSGNMMQH